MADISVRASDSRGTLRTRLMAECRRAPNGFNPDDVYAYVVRLQARIDFLEDQLRGISNVALLDAVLKQVADIRRQALASAEQAWLDIVEAAQVEATRQQAEAIREAGRLLDDACAEIRGIHARLQPPTPTTPSATHRHLDGSDTGAPQSKRKGPKPPDPSRVNGRSTALPDRARDASNIGDASAEPPFRLPTWIDE